MMGGVYGIPDQQVKTSSLMTLSFALEYLDNCMLYGFIL